ncbi:sn-glycerol-3-phosphate ABC transporter ATP-binding protein UgpC [Pseudaminobacter sp. 19-2017]|uniref:Sn-glycerol-3-phosphate ABC transporter ATP-binding protein UgpC n=1 Tax=Pseudaminobacter soli (ex Zhang et al. 2022) TaxID=2831468 RepID=A0A942IBA0_9HYPH|nr:sn-glycerol-3-phosphate ABC transporter ATP-binding protein UgpC [Pseudaminobacter soli]MBS3651381.1 sn-glycerol-3-phosphate ABC transporter ATP-binding protein UgpC [Pseudaminobacter soli]
MATVDLKDVRKTYPSGVEAVKGVSIAIHDKALCVLVGPSGCGKSTLLRMIAGLEAITDGAIAIEGKVVNAIGPAERDIAMVFQNYALYPHMSVYDNMAYGLRNRGTPRDEIDRRVRATAKTLELDHLLKRQPRELSGGQRQRVAMGRAIVRNPKVFLFDEPLSNLDAKLRGQMRVEIKNLQRALGVTSVYVTHDQLEAMTLADVLVVMNAGVVEQIGAPLDVYERPETTFVASFIGAPPMNLLPVAALPSSITSAAPAGAATLGFRPEDGTFSDHSEQSQLSLAAEVEGVEPVGAESFLYCRHADNRLILRASGRTTVEPGARLAVTIAPEKMHWFDGEGKRLS